MKITTLVAAAALAVASTAAVAETAAVTTPAGELVMVEKNAALGLLGGLFAAGAFALITVVASGGTE